MVRAGFLFEEELEVITGSGRELSDEFQVAVEEVFLHSRVVLSGVDFINQSHDVFLGDRDAFIFWACYGIVNQHITQFSQDVNSDLDEAFLAEVAFHGDEELVHGVEAKFRSRDD